MNLQVRVKVLFVFDGSVEEIPDGEEDMTCFWHMRMDGPRDGKSSFRMGMFENEWLKDPSKMGSSPKEKSQGKLGVGPSFWETDMKLISMGSHY